jgi:hypothetical protein
MATDFDGDGTAAFLLPPRLKSSLPFRLFLPWSKVAACLGDILSLELTEADRDLPLPPANAARLVSTTDLLRIEQIIRGDAKGRRLHRRNEKTKHVFTGHQINGKNVCTYIFGRFLKPNLRRTMTPSSLVFGEKESSGKYES